MRIAGAGILALLLLAGAAGAKEEEKDGTVVAGELGKRLDEAVAKATGGQFWGAVLVARDGEVVLAKGYGFADYAAEPNSPRTLFEIASASKQITAAAILKLQQQKKLSTGDPLSKFFPDVPVDKAGITIHQLLTHTSGFSPSWGVPYASPLDRKAWLTQIFASELDFPPGEKFAYCNAAYALLAAVVEVVSHRDFEDYVRRELFRPAKLEDTGFIGDEDLIASGRAAKRLAPGDPEWSAAKWLWGWGYRGMGGVVTTVWDLWRWDRALRGDKVLNAAAKEEMARPEKQGYAAGWFVETTPRGTTKLHHGGGVMGFGCWIARYLEDDAFIAVLSNGKTNPVATGTALERLLFPPPAISVVADVGDRPQNEYLSAQLGGKLRWEAKKEGGDVVLRLRGEKDVPLTLRLPAGAARALAASVESAVEARSADDPGGPAAMEAGLYFNRYGRGTRRVALDEGVEVRVLPMYVGQDAEGNRVEDRRATLVVDDTKNRQWPFMAKLNVAAAKELLAALRGAL